MVNNATNIWKNEQSLTSKKTMTYDIENPDTALGQVQKCVEVYWIFQLSIEMAFKTLLS